VQPAKKWRFLKDIERPGAYHMAVDAVLLESVGFGASPPTLRAYTWTPHAVSMGRGQRRTLKLDPKKCREAGVDVVVRPSGGRAVLHGEDVTYAAVFPVDRLGGVGGVGETYRRLAGVLTSALRSLGIETDLADSRALGGPGAALPCFTSAARDEILYKGRKLIGSAQRRTRSAVLQHGAILVRGSQGDLASLVSSDAEAGKLREDLAGVTVTLEEILRRPVEFEEVAAALGAAAEDVLGVSLAEGMLTEEEAAAVERIMREAEEPDYQVGGNG
jgi:lipoate-protein ligase A